MNLTQWVALSAAITTGVVLGSVIANQIEKLISR